MTAPALDKGDELPVRSFEITRDDLRRYAEASGDRNPIHLDDSAARSLGLPGVVAHGMLVMALAVGSVSEWIGGADRLLATDVRFASPVQVPADAPALLEVAGVVRKTDEEAGTANLALRVTAGGAKVLGKAIVTVLARDS